MILSTSHLDLEYSSLWSEYQKRTFLRQKPLSVTLPRAASVKGQNTSLITNIKTTTHITYNSMLGMKPQPLLYGQKGNTPRANTKRTMRSKVAR
jgi:hypothetical protein